MIPLSEIKTTSGQRLAFDVFAEDETIMLLRGTPIRSEHDARVLRSQGYYKPLSRSRVPVFSGFTRLADRLSHIFDNIQKNQETDAFSKQVHSLARDFIELCDIDPDAGFASIHLNIHHSYIVVHSMMAGIVCCRLALARGFSKEQRQSLVCAALTHDVGLFANFDLINSKDVLTESEMSDIRQHVQHSVQLLKRLGVLDNDWLEPVINHHEFLDGSGYFGKRGEELSIGTRILVLADSYSAMLRPRPYRDRVMARKALESLYSDGLDRYDGLLIESLIWDLGFYPPGSVLRLRNNEMAVVVRNSPGILDGPNVACFTDSRGCPLKSPILRNTNDPECAVVNVLDPSLARRMGQQIERCWTDWRGF